MNFDDYMRKIQYIANLLEQNEYAENVLNSKELDIANDFQYICLSSASNYKLVNEVIARLAQNGNHEIVEKNIKSISLDMWKDLFKINDGIKKIFVENFETILENTTVVTYREIEAFVNDEETYKLVCENLGGIVKKLNTYDRSALVGLIKVKVNGAEIIKNNVDKFFQKGEFDISTAYSRVIGELEKVKTIDKIEILKVCVQNLSEILNRETAIDNETNKLLNWVYDTFEENKLMEADKQELQEKIDSAITENFEYILYKSNYDKNTIKTLKQFSCIKELFDKNKNQYIDKSNKLNKQNVDVVENAEVPVKENKAENHCYEVFEQKNHLLEDAKANLTKEEESLKYIGNNVQNNREELVKKFTANNKKQTAAAKPYVKEYKSEYLNAKLSNILNGKVEAEPAVKKIEVDTSNDKILELVDETYIDNPDLTLDGNVEYFINEGDINTENDNTIVNFNSEPTNIISFVNAEKTKVDETNKTEEKQNIIDFSMNVENTLNDNIKALIGCTIDDTDKIIDKVMRRNEYAVNEPIIEKIMQKVEEPDWDIQIDGGDYEKIDIPEIEEVTDVKTNVETALIPTGNDMVIYNEEGLFKRILRKFLKLFGLKDKTEEVE